ncbi:MAG: GHKL domain-containing protein [Thomasclavelia sp.]
MGWIVINLIEALLLLWFVTYFLDVKKDKDKLYYLLLALSVFTIITISNYISMYDNFLTTVIIIDIIIISSFFTYNRLDEIIFIACFESMFTEVMCIITLAFDSYFDPFIVSLLRQMLYADMFIVLKHIYPKDNFYLSKELNILLSLLIFLLHFILQQLMQLYLVLEVQIPELFWTILLINFFVFVLIVLFLKLVHLNAVENKYKQLETKKQNEEVLSLLYEQLKIAKHDLKHDYNLISHYLKEKEYLKIEKMVRDKKKQINSIPVLINTSNKLINLIINDKIIKAYTRNIKVTSKIDINREIRISECDLNELLSNILDNAIDYNRDNGMIDIAIILEKQFVHIKVTNEIDKNKSNQSLISKKGKNHGYGIRSIEKIVEKYQGIMNIDYNEYFEITISLKDK